MAADSPYGDFYDTYSISPEYFGYSPVKYIGQKRQYATENRTRKLLNQNAQPENSKVSAHVHLLQVRRRTALTVPSDRAQRFIDKLRGGLRQRATSTTRNKPAGMLSDGDPHCGVHENMARWHAKYSLDGL
jgi:NAD-specific glutamate dehydrogenase